MKPLIAAVLGAFALGLLAGMGAAMYRPASAEATEAELRERALAYYKAGKVFDFRTMASLYTPAYQLDAIAELRDLVARRTREFASFKAETREDLQYSSDSITPDRIEVEINGRWAKSTGTCLVRTGIEDGVIGLETLVWVQDRGHWWIYQMKLPELAAYGNPPDNLRELLSRPQSDARREIKMQPPATLQSPDSGIAPEPGGTTGQ